MPFHNKLKPDVERLRESLPPLPEQAGRPCLILIAGLPGAGKSHFSRELASRIPAVILESDALRKLLFPRPLYTWQENRRLFEACHELALDLLTEGRNVIFDATNLQEAHRQDLYTVAERAGVRALTVWVQAPPEVIWERMASRQQRRNPEDRSEADWEVYQRLRGTEQPPRRNYFKVHTDRDTRPVIERIVRAVASDL